VFRRLPLAVLVAATALFALVARPGVARAQSGWLPTSWFSGERNDPQAMFPLAENDGPWLVLATTFRGEAARDEARALVQELRTRYRLEAFTHEKAFDYTGRQRGAGLNPDGTPKTMRYANAAQVVEVAVLVGSFSSCEDPRGQKALQKIKSLRPESLGGRGPKSGLVSDFLNANSDLARAARTDDRPPLQAAMMIPNPLLPDDYFARQQIDEFVIEMNADVTYSLLDCPGRYTVRVATFSGYGTFDAATPEPPAGEGRGGRGDVGRFVEMLRGNGWNDPKVRPVGAESPLVEAADKAHRLTVALRKQGWQAWEFHDRDSSMVCVGSVDQLAIPGPDGRPQVHPEIGRIVQGLGPDPTALAAGTILPRAFDGVMLDVQLKPIDVPRVPTRRR
jgi:hypothetical protein